VIESQKNLIFKNSKWQTATILNILISPCFGEKLSDIFEILLKQIGTVIKIRWS